MHKPTANYKMSGQAKRTLALSKFRNAEDRNAWKRAMIQAELTAAFQPKREKGRRNENGGE